MFLRKLQFSEIFNLKSQKLKESRIKTFDFYNKSSIKPSLWQNRMKNRMLAEINPSGVDSHDIKDFVTVGQQFGIGLYGQQKKTLAK